MTLRARTSRSGASRADDRSGHRAGQRPDATSTSARTSFRLTGKRVFRIAPLHHHFEVVGWAEITTVIRSWIIAGICVLAGLSLFNGEWVVAL